MKEEKPNVQDFYDNNTRRFLRLGQNQQTRNIHQPLWAHGARTLEQAVCWSNELVLREFRRLEGKLPNQRLHVLDLGCGVGSSLFYLGQKVGDQTSLTGISNSRVQVELAESFRSTEAGGSHCQFVLGDFLSLPTLPPVHLAYAIEAFLHAEDAAQFFAQAADKLTPSGRLVLIDDFLTERGERDDLPPKQQAWLADFRSGWLAGSLVSERRAKKLAGQSALRFVESENLTPLMKLGRPRDRMIGLMRSVAAPQMRRSTYFRALNGGYAKQQCLKHGLVEYRRVVFEA
jgi:cyclopropane fatty-acyl-phospholipid synthase-like methyltransferase